MHSGSFCCCCRRAGKSVMTGNFRTQLLFLGLDSVLEREILQPKLFVSNKMDFYFHFFENNFGCLYIQVTPAMWTSKSVRSVCENGYFLHYSQKKFTISLAPVLQIGTRRLFFWIFFFFFFFFLQMYTSVHTVSWVLV